MYTSKARRSKHFVIIFSKLKMTASYYQSHYDMVKANPYPVGYILLYGNPNGKTETSVVSLGGNVFVDIHGKRYNSYDEWIETLPELAKSDIGITEIEPITKKVSDAVDSMTSFFRNLFL